ncbi:MAG: amino acid adenylation domain-containing protein, partial [Deltaproteobacteria bacterium]|nr:amino acid adenylation domain-containing protein [Deltaproteobacteria bacterium]
MVKNPVTGWAVKFSQQHEDFLLSPQRGMPAPFDNGVMRFAWVSPLITNWMGDAGVLRRLSVQIVAPNSYGDTNRYHGKMTHRTEAEGGFMMNVEITGINQLGTVTTTGSADVWLPRRKGYKRHDVREVSRNEDLRQPATEEKRIHELIERHVRKRHSETAIVFGERQFTYGELNAQVERLAGHLRAGGVRAGIRVAFCMDRSPEMVVGLLAIFKAGGTFVPLDPDYPKERLAYMIEDASPAWVLTRKALFENLPKCNAIPIFMEADEGRFDKAHHTPAHDSGVADRDTAYIVYTSGATGRPKGVFVSHDSLSSYIQSLGRSLPVTGDDVYLQTASISFSAAFRQILLPLYKRAKLVIANEEQRTNPLALLELIKQGRITVWDTIPSVWYACSRALGRLKRTASAGLLQNDLQRIHVTGEPLLWEHVRAWRVGHGHKAEVVNLYSQTETTGTVCCYRVPCDIGGRTGVVPLGRPIDNTEVYVLDENLKRVEDPAEGEICVSGPQIAGGYWGQPGLTSERFPIHLFTADKGERLCRTGDRGRRLPDGTIEYLGRLDDQIKIRGFRISPIEIEAALERHPNVREAAVAESITRSGEKGIIAYVAPAESHSLTIDGRPRRKLPNNMAVAHLNRHETDFAYAAIFEEQTYLRHGITIHDGDCVFDVGANIGLFALFINLLCKSPLLHCFEPNPHVFSILKANTGLYAPGAKLYPFGLSDRGKRAPFTFFAGSSLQSGLYPDPDRDKDIVRQLIDNQRDAGMAFIKDIAEATDHILEQRFAGETFGVDLKTLSGVIVEQGIERIDLLKINVEKSEIDVLHGIREEDWRKIEQLVVKVDLSENLELILALLESHGYETAVDQDVLLRHTPIRTVYAIRPPRARRLIAAKDAVADRLPLPALAEPFVTAGDLRAFLGRRLPKYMIPSRFVFLEQLPRTPTGKIDRRALPGPEGYERMGRQDVTLPSTAIEADLMRIWLDLLEVKHIGIHDNFFELGGDSLQAVQVLAAMRAIHHVNVSTSSFFEQPTIAGLASIIENQRRDHHIPEKGPSAEELEDQLLKLDTDF